MGLLQAMWLCLRPCSLLPLITVAFNLEQFCLLGDIRIHLGDICYNWKAGATEEGRERETSRHVLWCAAPHDNHLVPNVNNAEVGSSPSLVLV